MDDERAASVEKLGERPGAVGAFEDIILLDLDPGQRAALFQQAVPLARPGLLLGEKRPPRLDPLIFRDDLMLGHDDLRSMMRESDVPACRAPRSSLPRGCGGSPRLAG